MMGRRRVLIAAFDGRTQPSEGLRRQLLRAWESSTGAEIDCVNFGSGASAEDLRRALKAAGAIVILLATRESTQHALLVIEAADRAGVPVLALREGASSSGTFAGALSMPACSSSSTVAAALDALIHAGLETRRLRGELSLANRCSGGLEGEIARMHEEMQLAAMVQRELLPRELPCLHGVSFGTLWRPANYVSGDIFDVARLDEDHVGVFLTDAVGHGVPAALLTMVISRSLVMKEISGREYRLLSPSKVLTRLNDEMIRRQGRNTRFATAVYALIDCRRRVMQVAGAGHPPPLLLRGASRSDGEMIPLETNGGLLGIFEDEVYDQVEVELNIDDRVLFYSDGFEQAFPSRAGDAHERRVPTMRYRKEFDAIARSGVPQDCIEELRKRLDVQSGSLHQADDLTLICVHAGPLMVDEVSEVGGQTSEVRGQKSEVGAAFD